MTNKISYLDDGELCVLTKDEVSFYDVNKKKINKKILTMSEKKFQLIKVNINILCLKKLMNSQILLKIV